MISGQATPRSIASYPIYSLMKMGNELNWFQRHLNWTMVFSWLFAPPVGLLCGLLVGLALEFSNLVETSEYLFTTLILPMLVIGAGLITWVTGWAIKKKGASLWNLIWLVVPFGFIPLLQLENRSEVR